MAQINDRIRELNNIKFDPFAEWTYSHQIEYDGLIEERNRLMKKEGLVR